MKRLMVLAVLAVVGCGGNHKPPIVTPPPPPPPAPTWHAIAHPACGQVRRARKPTNHWTMNTWSYAADSADLKRLDTCCNVAKYLIALDEHWDAAIADGNHTKGKAAAWKWLSQKRNWGIWNEDTVPHSLADPLKAVDHCGIRIVMCVDSHANTKYHRGRKHAALASDAVYARTVLNITGACHDNGIRLLAVQIENEPNYSAAQTRAFMPESYADRVRLTKTLLERYPYVKVLAGGTSAEYGIAAWNAGADFVGYHVVNFIEASKAKPWAWETGRHNERRGALRAAGIPAQRIVADEVLSPYMVRDVLALTDGIKGAGWTSYTGDCPWSLWKLGRWNEVEVLP